MSDVIDIYWKLYVSFFSFLVKKEEEMARPKTYYLATRRLEVVGAMLEVLSFYPVA